MQINIRTITANLQPVSSDSNWKQLGLNSPNFELNFQTGPNRTEPGSVRNRTDCLQLWYSLHTPIRVYTGHYACSLYGRQINLHFSGSLSRKTGQRSGTISTFTRLLSNRWLMDNIKYCLLTFYVHCAISRNHCGIGVFVRGGEGGKTPPSDRVFFDVFRNIHWSTFF